METDVPVSPKAFFEARESFLHDAVSSYDYAHLTGGKTIEVEFPPDAARMAENERFWRTELAKARTALQITNITVLEYFELDASGGTIASLRKGRAKRRLKTVRNQPIFSFHGQQTFLQLDNGEMIRLGQIVTVTL